MYTIMDLNTLKSKDFGEQISIIESLLNKIIDECKIDIHKLIDLTKNGVVDLAGEKVSTIIYYCLISIIASDVSTTMNPYLRKNYVDNLIKLSDNFGIKYDRVVYLAKYSESLFSYFESQCN
jgi:hypothetical protein